MATPRYSPQNPDNPMVFNRVPYEKRLHWLWLWNPSNDPLEIDCAVAVDTLAYFANHATQSQQQYYHGAYHGISDAKNDLDFCFQVKGMAANNLPEATRLLQQHTAEKEKEVEHVWKFRSVPLRIDPFQ